MNADDARPGTDDLEGLLSTDRELGFDGLLAAGRTPEQAWREIHDAMTPAARAIIADLAGDEQGRAALEWSRQRWALRGLRPPWEAEP